MPCHRSVFGILPIIEVLKDAKHMSMKIRIRRCSIPSLQFDSHSSRCRSTRRDCTSGVLRQRRDNLNVVSRFARRQPHVVHCIRYRLPCRNRHRLRGEGGARILLKLAKVRRRHRQHGTVSSTVGTDSQHRRRRAPRNPLARRVFVSILEYDRILAYVWLDKDTTDIDNTSRWKASSGVLRNW